MRFRIDLQHGTERHEGDILVDTAQTWNLLFSVQYHSGYEIRRTSSVQEMAFSAPPVVLVSRRDGMPEIEMKQP